MGTIFLPCCSPPGVEAWPSGEFRQLLLFEAPDEQQLQVRNLSREKSWRIRIQNGWMKWYFHNLCFWGHFLSRKKHTTGLPWFTTIFAGFFSGKHFGFLHIFFKKTLPWARQTWLERFRGQPATDSIQRPAPESCLLSVGSRLEVGLPESLDGGIMHILCMCVCECVCVYITWTQEAYKE